MGTAQSALVYPVVEFSQGHLVVVHDESELRRCTRTGVRRGWDDDLWDADGQLDDRVRNVRRGQDIQQLIRALDGGTSYHGLHWR